MAAPGVSNSPNFWWTSKVTFPEHVTFKIGFQEKQISKFLDCKSENSCKLLTTFWDSKAIEILQIRQSLVLKKGSYGFKTVNIFSSSLFLVTHERLDGWSTGHPGRLQQSWPLSAKAQSNFGLLVSSPSPKELCPQSYCSSLPPHETLSCAPLTGFTGWGHFKGFSSSHYK